MNCSVNVRVAGPTKPGAKEAAGKLPGLHAADPAGGVEDGGVGAGVGRGVADGSGVGLGVRVGVDLGAGVGVGLGVGLGVVLAVGSTGRSRSLGAAPGPSGPGATPAARATPAERWLAGAADTDTTIVRTPARASTPQAFGVIARMLHTSPKDRKSTRLNSSH